VTAIADSLWEWQQALAKLEEILIAGGLTNWENISGHEHLDCLIVYEVQDDNRLTIDGMNALRAEGFYRVNLCHRDGSRTRYSQQALEGERWNPKVDGRADRPTTGAQDNE